MSQTFRGYTFDVVQDDDGTLPLFEFTANVTARHIPGGDVNYVDLGGLNVGKLTIPSYCITDADFNGLRGSLGRTGTLVLFGTTYLSAIMSQMAQPKKYIAARINTGETVLYEFTLEFTIGV